MKSKYANGLLGHINDLDCQIEYLMHAVKLNLTDKDEEFRLNALIVRRAHYRKKLTALESSNKVCSILDKFKSFSHQQNLISDYFTPNRTN